MTREDNPSYFFHVCDVINAVFRAEHNTIEKLDIKNRLKNKEITPDEYVEFIAEELIRPTDPSEVIWDE